MDGSGCDELTTRCDDRSDEMYRFNERVRSACEGVKGQEIRGDMINAIMRRKAEAMGQNEDRRRCDFAEAMAPNAPTTGKPAC